MSSDYSAIFQLHAELSSLKTVSPIQGKNGGFEAISFSLSLSFSLSFSHLFIHTIAFSSNSLSLLRDFFSFLDTIFCVTSFHDPLLRIFLSCPSSYHCTTTADASFYRVVNRSRSSFFFFSRGIVKVLSVLGNTKGPMLDIN